MVQGCGAIGLLTLGLARQAGATRAIVVGGPAERLEVARAFGADVTIDIDTLRDPDERTRAVLAETPYGLGADYQDAVVAGRILEAGRLPCERLVSHQLPLDRVEDAIQALNSDYRVDGRVALKIAIAPNGPVA